jgi:translation initiation factor 1 (eIF-1/SUI1)
VVQALPMLVSNLMGQHIKPASQTLKGSPDLNVKQTTFKKIGKFLEKAEADGLIKLEMEKAGVQKLVSVNRLQSELVSFDVEGHTAPEEVVEDVYAISGHANAENKWQGKLPTKGTKSITIKQQKVRGNKNITVISNLEGFGIKLDRATKQEMTKKFSVAVSYSDDVHGGGGTIITVQGKFVTELHAFVRDRFGIPHQHIRIEGKKKGKGGGGGGGAKK